MAASLDPKPIAPETLREWFVNSWRPSDREESTTLTDVEGEIPREIHGTLYRNGPSQKILPRAGHGALHLFDGDGLVHAFRFDDGTLRMTSRFVRNDSFEAEQAAGFHCQESIGCHADQHLAPPVPRIQPNTNVVHHGGRLLALVENAPPFELDPRSLDPKGTWALDGKMVGPSTTAHPKIDGRSGQMVLHGYSSFPPFLSCYVIEPDGVVSQAEVVDSPYGVMMHDVAITENHIVFPLVPVVIDNETVMNGGTIVDAFVHDRDKPLLFGVRRRGPGSPVRWFEAPTPAFLFHFGNAYERGDKIVFDTCSYLDPRGLLDSLRGLRSGKLAPGVGANPFLYEIDLAAGTCSERKLDDQFAEFPRCDDRLVGFENRWGYAAVSRPGATDRFERVFATPIKYDRQGGPSVYHDFGPGSWCGEPVFVPRHEGAEEDDGFVLFVVYEGASDESSLVVLDARDFGGEPLARVKLPYRIPQGFHGNFAPGVV